MVVLVVGVLAVMRLFPVGLDSERDAVGHTLAAQTAESLLQFYVLNLKNPAGNGANWTGLGLVLPTAKPGAGEPADWAVWDKVGNLTLWRSAGTPGFARIEQSIPGTDANDFFATCRVWRDAVVSWRFENGHWTEYPVPPADALGLNLEVSWPATIPRERRRAALYRIEVFRPE